MKTGYFNSFDGAELFFREWKFKPEQKTIIILHRGHEHSERLNEFATNSRFEKYNIFGYDQRGNGYTKQKVSPIFMDSVRDLDCFVSFLNSKYGISSEDIFIVANSIAGVIVSAWVHDFAPKIAGMVLLAPAFEINLYVPLAVQFITLGTKIKKDLTVKSYVKAKMLTHDEEQQKAYDADSLITKDINARLLIDLHNAGKRLVEDASAIDLPTLMLSADKDYVVKTKAQKQFFVGLESECKEFILLKDFYHGVLFEKDRHIVYDHILRFADKCFALENQENKPLNPDKFTQDEFHKMNLGLMSQAENLNYKFQKWALKNIGSLSKGMEIGLKYGFDSGISLDYVYKNQPQGKLGIGKMIDSNYLNAIGWKGIRKRKENLLQLLSEAVENLQSEGKFVKILDIAGGTGNYLFSLKEKFPDIEVVINEFKLSNIEVGEKYITEKGLTNIRFTNYDCFDLETYQKLNYQPNIIIISGIFELFEDNHLINKAISGAVSIAENNGYLVYTGQPWHPQLKTIAYVLNSHQEKDWVMRRRSQKELDRIFAFNQVKKEKMLLDDNGIFTVSLGRILKR
ncbi:class I SAM-dependent methyltransferase family protein [Weeksellaceae bacterium TAE3-ERU29]|nr:class I SAM-dependent methyltransferase family protein [Weeksellaceae bacterium TAE3-ERU29]